MWGLAFTSANQPAEFEEEHDMEDRFLNASMPVQDDEDAGFQEYLFGQHSEDKFVGPSSAGKKGRKKKNIGTDAADLNEAIKKVVSTLSSDISMASQRVTSDIVNKEEEFIVWDCQKIIAEMNVPPPTYVRAMQYFMDHKDWCSIFGFMSPEVRLDQQFGLGLVVVSFL